MGRGNIVIKRITFSKPELRFSPALENSTISPGPSTRFVYRSFFFFLWMLNATLYNFTVKFMASMLNVVFVVAICNDIIISTRFIRFEEPFLCS